MNVPFAGDGFTCQDVPPKGINIKTVARLGTNFFIPKVSLGDYMIHPFQCLKVTQLDNSPALQGGHDYRRTWKNETTI